MTEATDRLWKKPQNMKDFAKSVITTKKSQPNNLESNPGTWMELQNHPSWNNLFTLLENYINCRAEPDQKTDSEKQYVVKSVSIRKKYKKYKKRYKLYKSETSQASHSGCECPLYFK